jgi:hypothetical protein
MQKMVNAVQRFDSQTMSQSGGGKRQLPQVRMYVLAGDAVTNAVLATA